MSNDRIRSSVLALLTCATVFILDVIAAVTLFDHAESQPYNSFAWRWEFWAAIALLLVANIALAFALKHGVRLARKLAGRFLAGRASTTA